MSHDEETARSGIRDETALRWSFLEQESEACVVLSDRMELVYVNAAASPLVPELWFGKRCFEVMPVIDEMCALHCPTIKAVSEATEVAFCREAISSGDILQQRTSYGVGLIPLPGPAEQWARAVFLLRKEPEGVDPETFEYSVTQAARSLRDRIQAQLEL